MQSGKATFCKVSVFRDVGYSIRVRQHLLQVDIRAPHELWWYMSDNGRFVLRSVL
jgi:hypothetical protein